MTWPAITTTAYFDLSSGPLFVLDDPVRGVLDNATYLLSGNIATDISHYVREVSITRGRQRVFDVIETGTCVVTLDNRSRRFDSLYSGSPFFGNVVPGKRFTIALAGVTIFDGKVESFRYTYARNQVPLCVVTLVDALGTLAEKALDSFVATASQTAGTRIGAVLDRPEVQFSASRQLDAGVFPMQADTIPVNMNALKYCQQVSKSDFGRLFADRDNVLTFRDRRSGITSSPAALFNLTGSGFDFIDVQRDTGTELLVNRVQAARRGGAVATFTNQASIDVYGVHGLSNDQAINDLLLLNDADAYEYGLFIANSYSVAEERFRSFTFRLNKFTALQQATLAALDIASLVQGQYTPQRIGTAIDRYCVVEGFNFSLQRNKADMTVFVGDAANRSSFILDDSVYGVLNGIGVLTF